jgi:response regulator of citrate/malate metabolism
LSAFARFHRLLAGDRRLDQTGVERAKVVLHEADSPTASMSKGRSAVTADSIREALRSSGDAMTAEAIGVSRANRPALPR